MCSTVKTKEKFSKPTSMYKIRNKKWICIKKNKSSILNSEILAFHSSIEWEKKTKPKPPKTTQ